MHRRILLAILLAVAVTGAALGIPLGITASLLVSSLASEDLKDRAQRIVKQLDSDIAAGDGIDTNRVHLAIPADGYLVVRGPGGRVYREGVEPEGGSLTEEANLAGTGEVRLSVPSEPLRERQSQVTVAVLLLAVLSVGTGMVVATVTARRLARPLRDISYRAARLGAGDFRPDTSRYNMRELDMVAEALDTSAEALSALVRRERQFVGDVSHQLRSRLTAIQLRLDPLTTHSDPEVAEDSVAAQEQADQLAAVLDELLAAARAAREAGAEPVDLSAVLKTIAIEWRQIFNAEGRTLRLRISKGLIARVTPARLREVVGVLLDNARKHGEGTVTMAARGGDTDGTVVVTVADHGQGVPDALAPHIFDRGVSGAGSTGVGLALARALVEADGGRLELSVQRPATFSVFLLVPRPTDLTSGELSTAGSPR
ncbi:ATP-binding protein [Haloechinothrix halophila]|uniref:ATP-binding protein n=1 Tax=Haloechinothrix halophila TaxID=1069073 RepID=UPI0003F7A3A1|nr:ATP-binding protein [Haloechinothrix halophila]